MAPPALLSTRARVPVGFLLMVVVLLCAPQGTSPFLLKLMGMWDSSPQSNDSSPYTWISRENYYYSDVRHKMNSIMHFACSENYELLEPNNYSLPSSSSSIHVSPVFIPKDLVAWWRRIPAPKQHRVDPFLCDVIWTKAKPIWNATTCQLRHMMNPSAPRCQTTYLKWVCDNARKDINDSTSNGFVLPESDHPKIDFLPPQPWLVTLRDSYVSMCGHVVPRCGLIHTNANCMSTGMIHMSKKFKGKCPFTLIDDAKSKGYSAVQCSPGTPLNDTVTFVDRVFVAAEVDDTYVYHIHLEIMPRILLHLDFLQANPDVRILVGCDHKGNAPATQAGIDKGLQAMKPFMDLAGLAMDRLIVHRHVYANEIYLPTEGGCQDPVYNTWGILHMRRLYFQMARIPSDMPVLSEAYMRSAQPKGKSLEERQEEISAQMDKATVSHMSTQIAAVTARSVANKQANEQNQESLSRPLMLILQRTASSKHTRNGQDLVRQWSNDFTHRMHAQLNETFGRHYRVEIFGDRNNGLMGCHACQMKIFRKVKVLIGAHGAGLANMIYMPPNGAVMEMAPYPNDGRCLLGGGPFSRAAAVLSHNYAIHHPPYSEFTWMTKTRSSEFDLGRFVLHIQSFLKSIDFI